MARSYYKPRFMEKSCPDVPPQPSTDKSVDYHTMSVIEFKMRIMIGMLNGIEYDKTTTGASEEKDYVESL